MDQPTQAQASPDTDGASLTTQPAPQRGIGRRALLRGGAAAAPVLLTLHSGPVAAGASMSCTVASSFVSAVTFASRNPGVTTMQCSTLNADHWHREAKANLARSPEHRAAWAKIKLVDYLGQSCSSQSNLPGDANQYQLCQVMGLGTGPATGGEIGVLHHILGLALSIDYGGSAVNTGGKMTRPYLAEIWRSYRSSGRYTLPSAGVNWTEAQLISWLRMLQYPIPVPAA